MPTGTRHAVRLLALIAAATLAGCSGVLTQQYEYEEELYLDLDG